MTTKQAMIGSLPINQAQELWCRLEQLDRIPIGVLKLYLLTLGSCLHLIAKMQASLPQAFDSCREVRHLQNDTVPSAGSCCWPSWTGRDPDAPGPLNINFSLSIDT